MKVGLALGGGASRGLAHLGVIQALVESKIPIDLVTGASVGGIIGSIYASHPDIHQAVKNVDQFLSSEHFNQTRLDFVKASKDQSSGYYQQLRKMVTAGFFFAVSTTRSSFISRQTFEENLSHLISKIQIEDCPVPLGVVATSLESGLQRNFVSGSMMQAVLSTAAIPGIFPPIQIDGHMYVDGSWVVPVPVGLARKMGANMVIAVDVAPNLGNDSPYQAEMSGWDVQLRSSEASRLELKRRCLSEADVAIVVQLPDLHWADFGQLDLCVEQGYVQTMEAIATVKQQLSRKKLKHILGFN